MLNIFRLAGCVLLMTSMMTSEVAQAEQKETPIVIRSDSEAYDMTRLMATTGRFPDVLAMTRTMANEGNTRAQYIMGRLFTEGAGVDIDNSEAAMWFKKAAMQGHAESQQYLSHVIEKIDSRASIFWLKESASQGYGPAQLMLGLKYSSGTGVVKDESAGYFWLLLASVNGSKKVQDMMEYVGSKLTPDQRDAAQIKARAWLPKAGGPVSYPPVENQSSGNTSTPARPDSTGSGFRVSRGNVVTNYHVVDGCKKVFVNSSPATVSSVDPRGDLALIIDGNSGASVTLRTQRAAVGEPVAVAGFPLRGLLSGFNMTTGTLSSLSGLAGDTRLFQITAPVQPGNSGGPLLDSAGNLLGVVVSKLDAIKTASVTGDIPQNVNFAINVNVLRSFLDANSVDYDSATSSKTTSSIATAERAKGYTTLIECWK